MEIKIVSWNMCYEINYKEPQVPWNYILNKCKYSPDIVCFQEGYTMDINGQCIFNESETNKKTPRWGTGIFVRQKFEFGKIVQINYPKINIINNRVTRFDKTVIGKIEINNKDLYLVSTHIDSSKKSRENFITVNNDVILDHIEEVFSILTPLLKDKSCIICGDFNADRSMGVTYKEIFNRICSQYDEWQYIHDGHKTQTYFGQQMSIRNHYQDDHIFISKNLSKNIKEIFVGNYGQVKKISDHTPIFMSIEI